MKNKLYSKIFLWLFLGLLLSFLTGFIVSNYPNMIMNILSPAILIILLIAEIVVAAVLGVRITKMQPITAKILYFLYSFLTGLTLSLVFVAYELTSIILVFGITSALFGAFALIGKFTKLDLSKIGTFLLMGLIAIIVATIINMFIGSEMLDMLLCYAGIILFLGYIAYDIQMVKRLELAIPDEDNLAVFAAFQLYVDFINLFYRILQLIGKYKD